LRLLKLEFKTDLKNPVLLISLTLAIALLDGCGPQKAPRETSDVCYPYATRVEVNDRQMTVIWKKKCNQLISGYFIYISKEPLSKRFPSMELPESVAPFNYTPFPGDTNPNDELEHFVAKGLDNGVKYYVSVRVVYPDRTLSNPSNEVLAVCGPRGEIDLSIRYKSERDGFSFEKNAYVRADDIDNDLYFYSKDGTDYLASPNRLGGFLKANKFYILPLKGEFEQVKTKLSLFGSTPTQDRVAVNEGDWVHILTPDRKNALVKVLSISGEGEHRSVRLFYAFSPFPNEAIF